MQGIIAKWGNSLAVRLPKQLAVEASLVEGTKVTLRAEAGVVVIEPARPSYQLDDLLAEMKPDTAPGETDWGPAQGKEEW